ELDHVDAALAAEPERRGVADVAVLADARLVDPRRPAPEFEPVPRDRLARVLERRNARQQFVHQRVRGALHPGGAHREPRGRRARGVEAATERLFFEDPHARARNVAIADQIDGGGQRGDAASDRCDARALRGSVHRGFVAAFAGMATFRRGAFWDGLRVFTCNSSKASTSARVSRWASGTAARAVVKPNPIEPA